MANPRKITRRDGLSPRVYTFAHDASIVFSEAQSLGSVSAGLAVKIVSNGVVALVTSASHVLGRLVKVESDGFCAVQVGGTAKLASEGTTTAGTKICGAATTAGKIRSIVAATLADVAVGRGLVLDATDADNVEVELG